VIAGTFPQDVPFGSRSSAMVKRLRFQENRRSRRRNGREPRGQWVLEPLDVVLAALVVAILLWLQWLSANLGN
jgi:hypothetical protein